MKLLLQGMLILIIIIGLIYMVSGIYCICRESKASRLQRKKEEEEDAKWMLEAEKRRKKCLEDKLNEIKYIDEKYVKLRSELTAKMEKGRGKYLYLKELFNMEDYDIEIQKTYVDQRGELMLCYQSVWRLR